MPKLPPRKRPATICSALATRAEAFAATGTRFFLRPPLILATVGIFAGLRYRSARVSRLTAKDPVVLADFSNNTGDAVFDGSLKQALKVALSSRPFSISCLKERCVRL